MKKTSTLSDAETEAPHGEEWIYSGEIFLRDYESHDKNINGP